jgi:hypothetical protein
MIGWKDPLPDKNDCQYYFKIPTHIEHLVYDKSRFIKG